MKKRLMKKYLKRISDGQRLNKQVPFFYVSQAKKIVDDYLEWFHFSVFRPWWYQQDWKEMDFAKTITEQYKSAEDDFQSKWSIDLMALSNEYKSRKRLQTRKPGKPKPEPPVRRLRNPEVFSIRLRSGEWVGVEGEVAFEHQGYKFFIYHTGSYWSVADVITGALIKSAETYKKAVNQARERIISNFDAYVKITEKTLVH